LTTRRFDLEQFCYQGLYFQGRGQGQPLIFHGQSQGEGHKHFSRPSLFLKAKDTNLFPGQLQEQAKICIATTDKIRRNSKY